MILLQTTSGTYEGSVRDLYNRNLLDIFKSCIQAEGHGPAFGVKIDKKDIEDNIYILDNLLSEIQDNNTGIILLDWSMYNSKDKELLEDIQLMAEYNEYSGQGLPCAYAKLPIKTNMTIKRYPNVTRIYWGNMHELVLFGRYISQGDTAIVSPSYPNRLIIKNIIYKY
jgi:single-stranded DNA-specific DHH superfamily exonuclease